jgi:hypothetical protein
MNFRSILYGLFCASALVYLIGANARGYVPFAAPTSRSMSGGSGMYYHK